MFTRRFNMLSRLMEKVADAPRESLFLAVVFVTIGALLVAMYTVCNTQTRLAEERRAFVELQRLAVLDCLRLNPHVSYPSCRQDVVRRLDPLGAEAQATNATGGLGRSVVSPCGCL
jgi:hypothetical protein